MSEPSEWPAATLPPGPGQPLGPPRPASRARTGPRSNHLLTGAVIQLVQSGVWAVVSVFALIDAARLDSLTPDLAERFDTPEDAATAMIGEAGFQLMVVAAMVTLGIITLRYVNGCRIASAIMQIILGSAGLLSVVLRLVEGPDAWLILDIATVITCVVVAVCLYHDSARNACQARRAGAWRPPPPVRYPGGYPPYAGGPPPYAGGPDAGSSPWAGPSA